eukprot:GILJ01000400.1.p1 GENE.GILJ01000400.1~~GILJ01000400.1.p1  ORF type:complete len:179 (+),score=14.77 GILJ01000400.1:98-634(+)
MFSQPQPGQQVVYMQQQPGMSPVAMQPQMYVQQQPQMYVQQPQMYVQQPAYAQPVVMQTIIQQQAAPKGNGVMTGQWSSGLCSCADDCGTCMCSFCCYPCQFGKNAEQAQIAPCGSRCCMMMIFAYFGVGLLCACNQRGEIRMKYDIPGNGCTDCCTVVCCPCCAVAQEARHVFKLGY